MKPNASWTHDTKLNLIKNYGPMDMKLLQKSAREIATLLPVDLLCLHVNTPHMVHISWCHIDGDDMHHSNPSTQLHM